MSIVQGSQENFDQEVLQSQEKVLVDFYADWCGPCKMVAPVLEEIAQDGVIKVVKVNVDENRDLAGKYRVMSIPTLIVFKDGQVKETIRGAVAKQDILNTIETVD